MRFPYSVKYKGKYYKPNEEIPEETVEKAKGEVEIPEETPAEEAPVEETPAVENTVEIVEKPTGTGRKKAKKE